MDHALRADVAVDGLTVELAGLLLLLAMSQPCTARADLHTPTGAGPQADKVLRVQS